MVEVKRTIPNTCPDFGVWRDPEANEVEIYYTMRDIYHDLFNPDRPKMYRVTRQK